MRTGEVGTVVLTAGTTGVGAVDPIHEALAWRERYGVRIHVDAAYGGFFTLLAGTGLVPEAPFRAIGGCDSVVVDPHKHGLQPYGCGAVSSPTRASGGSTSTTRRTRTSRPTSCTWGRSASSAPARAPRRVRCG